MIKRLRKVFTLLMGFFMAVTLFAPAMTSAATPRPEKGTLTVHKLQYNDTNTPAIENSGLEIDPSDLPGHTRPLDGTEFTIYKVADDAEMPINTDGLTPAGVQTTSGGGIAVFPNLSAGRYLVVETNQPKGVYSYSAPFLVDVPMMNPDGRGWNSNVHVYPKNQLILGAVDLTKWAEEEDGDRLNGAVFSLFTEDGELIASGLTTVDGKIHVGELEVGSYYFMETAAPEGYGLDQTKIEFEITENDHAYDNEGELIESKLLEVSMVNYDIPDIEKFFSEEGNKEETADYLEEITWVIKPEVPNNIETYSKFVVKDTFGPQLTYLGELVVQGTLNGSTVNIPHTASGVSVGDNGGTLEIAFNPQNLDGVTDLTITFQTHLNESAILGRDYENNVILEMNNRFSEYVETEEEPPVVHTGGKPFKKVNSAEQPLEGAEFVIYRMNNGQKQYLTASHGWGSKGEARTFVSDSNGLFDVKGLAYGEYYLEETKAPKVGDTQYQLLPEDVLFTVNATSYYSDPMSIPADKPNTPPTAEPAKIINRTTDIKIPQTGGIGTLMFTLVGLGLMGSSVRIYKKNNKDEE